MTIYNEIIKRFPRNIIYSFAYGSGVKQQIGYNIEKKIPVIDLIFCVDNEYDWHMLNLKQNPSHYSGLKIFGHNFLAKYQNSFGARVYFNTLIPIRELDVKIKYGVVSKDHLLDDLERWDYLYIAGRLHKPIHVVTQPPWWFANYLLNAYNQNLRYAFLTALLLLPEKFSEYELFHAISSLSYKGDFRMIFGENKNKINNIVAAQMKEFFNLYHPILKEFSNYIAVYTNRREVRMFQQDKSTKAIEQHLIKLPYNLQNQILKITLLQECSYSSCVGEISVNKDLSDIISQSVNKIVWNSSLSQSIKNIPTAGLFKSFQYSYQKTLKMFNK